MVNISCLLNVPYEVILVNCFMKLVMKSILRIMYKRLISLSEACKVCDVMKHVLKLNVNELKLMCKV